MIDGMFGRDDGRATTLDTRWTGACWELNGEREGGG